MTLIRAGGTPRLTLRRIAVTAVTLFAAANLIVGIVHGDGGSRQAPANDAEIEAFLAEEIHDAGYPGASFAIVRDGRITHSGGIGRADASGRPVRPDTPFVIGSLSKAITATALMQLVQAGRVELDAPVRTYLPDFALASTGVDKITLRQLLHHTSGIPTLAGVTPLAGPVTTLAAQVEALRSVRLQSEPGSTIAYSNANYVVLGLVIERVSERTFGTYVAEEIFTPLRMDDSHVDINSAVADDLTDAHRFWFGNPTGGDPLWRPDLMPSGWLVASADDLGRFLAANLSGGAIDGARVLPREAIEELHAGAVDAGRGRYGMGWVDGALGETRIVSHSGSTTDMASAMYLAPEENVGLVVLYNGQSLVYELLHKGESIAEAAMARLLGEAAGGTLGALYPAFTAAVVLMVALQGRAIVRAVGHARRGEPTVRPILGHRWIGVMTATWSLAIAPALVLWATPDTFGAPWSVLVHIDLGQALAAYALLQLVLGAIIVVPPLVRRAGAVGRPIPRPTTGQHVG